MSCPNIPSTKNGAHYRGLMYLPVEEDSVSPSPLLTGFHERYNGAPMETNNIKRNCWSRQEEEIIYVNNLPIISDIERATIINVTSNLIACYQLAHKLSSVKFSLFHCHLVAQRLLASFWGFLNSKAGILEQLPNVKRLSNCIQNFVHPAIHHLLGVKACHYMKVWDLVASSNHQQEYQAALVRRLDLNLTASQHSPGAAEYPAAQNCGQDTGPKRGFTILVSRCNPHFLALEHYVEGAARREANHQEETVRCTSELADVRSKLEALTKEFEGFSQTNHSELNRIKYLSSAAQAKIVELKNNFVKYDNHHEMVLEEKLATLFKEIEEKLLLASQTPAVPGTTNTIPEIDEILCQINSLAILNNLAFLQINKVNERHKQQQVPFKLRFEISATLYRKPMRRLLHKNPLWRNTEMEWCFLELLSNVCVVP
ncbi:hypothetical protein DSO57_1005230 [Entomophthora muscae]|uniref:Uncharacterized protein n=1 Tax=Entomophthora muscae TaxID=34485 RepID=A0ACC2U6L8_9FUNG|nr:hypothetical protein DSO57_1005230 [Entomophthora muscae]